MYGEIVTRLRYKPSQLEDKVFKVTGHSARLYNDPPEIPFPVLSDYEYCTASLESYEDNKDKIYDVQYELHYKWNNVLYKLDTTISENGTAEFTRLIKGLTYYITAIPLDGKYQSKQMKIVLDEYDIRQEPAALTTYENSDYKNYDHYLILKNIFGDANVYLEGNPEYISLDRNDKNLRVYLNKDATERASEFDLIIEDYRIEDIIVSRKTISVNDGFSSPYDISIEFTDSNAAIFRWKADGEYSINKFYISNSINDKEIPTDVIDTSTYIITNYDNSKTHYLWISSIRDGKEKISDPVTIDSFDKSLNPLVGPDIINYSMQSNNDLVVNLSHNSSNVDNYSVYLEENEITSIDGLKPIVTSTSKNIVIPNFDVYNNYDRTLKLLATTNKYNHSYLSENKDLYVAYDWTPNKLIDPPKLWLSSENVITDNNIISQVNDLSGNNYNAVQIEANLKPKLVNKAIQLDGIDDYLNIKTEANDIFRNVNKAWVFAVFSKQNIDDTNKERNIILFTNNASGAYRVGLNIGQASADKNIIFFGGRRLDSEAYSGASMPNSVIAGKIYIAFGYIDYSMNLIQLYIDGLLVGEKENAFTSAGNTSDTSSLRARLGSNGGTPPSQLGDINIYTTIVNNTSINLNQRQKLEGWAAHKYGLTDNLPSDHPYKTKTPIIDHAPYNLTAEFKND